MEESKELQGVYKIFRTAIYVSPTYRVLYVCH